MKFNIIISYFIFLFDFLIVISGKYKNKFSNLKSQQVITNVNDGSNGGEVVIACSECQKILSKYINNCSEQEASGAQVETLRAFCESSRVQTEENKFSKINDKFCLILNDKLSRKTNQSGFDLLDPTKSPGICMRFKNECDKHGGSPQCYSGFCENVAECIDCPTALVDVYKNGNFQLEVCGNAGICKLGWLNTNTGGGNGYCVCNDGMKGLACNEY